jgi:hypothetical protein
MAHSEFYFENLTGTVRVYLDHPPQDLPPAPELTKFTLKCTSCYGFSGNTIVKPITTVVDVGADDSGAKITFSCVMKKTTYLSIINLFKAGKMKFFDAENNILYMSVSMEKNPFAANINGVTDEPMKKKFTKCTFELTVC